MIKDIEKSILGLEDIITIIKIKINNTKKSLMQQEWRKQIIWKK